VLGIRLGIGHVDAMYPVGYIVSTWILVGCL
jgi:hypothetical protein